jgi:hypothetical protein
LHFVVLSIKELSFVFLDPHPQNFNLLRQSLNFDGLEHNDELYILTQISLLVVGQILNAGSLL